MDWEHIKLASHRRAEIKQQIAALTAEDKEIVEWLDAELVVNKLDNKTQKFEGPGITVKVKVPQNFTVDTDAFDTICNDNPEFQEIAGQLFSWKLQVSEGSWNKASEDLKQLFAPAVTIKQGKSTYEFLIQEEI